MWNVPKSVAVESFGFWDSAPIWRRRGRTYILLTSDHMHWVEAFFPEGSLWVVQSESREISGYVPHEFLGYGETPTPGHPHPIGSSRGDLVVDAALLLGIMSRTEAAYACRVVNGTRIVVALLQAALGLPATGRAIPVHACPVCGGKGKMGDYARGTGRQCEPCGGSGEIRDAMPTSEVA